jgi:hypothetical protein
MSHVLSIYNTYKPYSARAQYSISCSIICSVHCLHYIASGRPKHRFQQLFHCCMLLHCCGQMFIKPLPSKRHLFWLNYSIFQVSCHNIYSCLKIIQLFSFAPSYCFCTLGPYYFGIKLFNHFPLNIKELSYNAKQFRMALWAFLYSKSFYILDEYFNQG